jgi:hypothetical protein
MLSPGTALPPVALFEQLPADFSIVHASSVFPVVLSITETPTFASPLSVAVVS